jgi:transcriptional regulator with XRE-family HTH domain
LKFAKALYKLRTRAKLTRYRLAQEAGVDPSHVARLERAERLRPSRHLVLRLGQALLDNSGDISLEDIDELLNAASYGPLPKTRISITSLK